MSMRCKCCCNPLIAISPLVTFVLQQLAGRGVDIEIVGIIGRHAVDLAHDGHMRQVRNGRVAESDLAAHAYDMWKPPSAFSTAFMSSVARPTVPPLMFFVTHSRALTANFVRPEVIELVDGQVGDLRLQFDCIIDQPSCCVLHANNLVPK
jgi:hypothetical protein